MEIRGRTLENVMSKVSTGIIQLSDIAENNELLAHLAQWFDHDECTMELELVGFLISLSESSSEIAERLVKLGVLGKFQRVRAVCGERLASELAKLLRLLHSVAGSMEMKVVERNNREGESVEREIEEKFRVDTQKFLNPEPDVTPVAMVVNEGDALWRFPIVSMIRNDERFLFDLFLRFKIDDVNAISSAFDDLEFCVLQEFPIECCLQRTQVLRVSLVNAAVP